MNDLGFAYAFVTTITRAVIIAVVQYLHPLSPRSLLNPYRSIFPARDGFHMLFNSTVPASVRPIVIITGPTTIGGKSFLIFSTPIAFIIPANIRYTHPAEKSAIITAKLLPGCPYPAAKIPGKKAKLDPRNTGTFLLVSR